MELPITSLPLLQLPVSQSSSVPTLADDAEFRWGLVRSAGEEITILLFRF
ncbi:MAG: hypothetical protein ACE5GV_09325 [Candidatus Scalindua sp.]